ncbi:hypothetical protein LX64_04193 [Chitinophaga skermanii]|uniref:Uncharacterized protein n=1 Tax=Chitinophaga skermanii TaxID=331697 RepID=A0A327QFM8_9BACT|nr:hypothetical protein LX64_04193 [Chitinophaga skermanii]
MRPHCNHFTAVFLSIIISIQFACKTTKSKQVAETVNRYVDKKIGKTSDSTRTVNLSTALLDCLYYKKTIFEVIPQDSAPPYQRTTVIEIGRKRESQSQNSFQTNYRDSLTQSQTKVSNTSKSTLEKTEKSRSPTWFVFVVVVGIIAIVLYLFKIIYH